MPRRCHTLPVGSETPNQRASMPTQTSPSDSTRLIGRLDRLVTTLLRARFASAADLWRLETDLLRLQQDVQTAVTAQKRLQRRSPDQIKDLEQLRWIRWNARRLGDAFAWLVLGLDRRALFPLAQNSRVSIPPDDHGTRAMVAIAEGLAVQNWGFPLLHDVTDCLRIGDITFVKPDEETTTVEVKARVVGEGADHDGKPIVEYEVTVVGVSDVPPLPNSDPVREPLAVPTSREPRSRNRRMSRQMHRLGVAKAHQTAEAGTVSEIDGKSVITACVEDGGVNHAGVVRRVARRARRNGFATAAVDDAILYCAAYHQDGMDADKFGQLASELPSEVLSSGILFRDNPERNSLVIYPIPETKGGAQLYLPYFLYGLPRSTILDLLHGRMMFSIVVNSGRIVEALESAGFKVVIRKGRNDLSPGSIVLCSEFEFEGGVRYAAEFHNLNLHIYEMLMEFKSVQYVVNVADVMRTEARLRVPA